MTQIHINWFLSKQKGALVHIQTHKAEVDEDMLIKNINVCLMSG
jgi:hypothetical protein